MTDGDYLLVDVPIMEIDLNDLKGLLEAAARRGAEIALEKNNQPQMLDKAAAAALLGIKSYSTLKKMASTPGFPLSVRGRFSRSELEAWAGKRGAR